MNMVYTRAALQSFKKTRAARQQERFSNFSAFSCLNFNSEMAKVTTGVSNFKIEIARYVFYSVDRRKPLTRYLQLFI